MRWAVKRPLKDPQSKGEYPNTGSEVWGDGTCTREGSRTMRLAKSTLIWRIVTSLETSGSETYVPEVP